MAWDMSWERNLHTWIRGWFSHRVARAIASRFRDRRHLLFAFCDHHEPLWNGADAARGRARIQAWAEGYPALAKNYRDADGRPPQHTFFFPSEQYRPELLDSLAKLAGAGLGEVELHLHHEGDTRATLRPQLEQALTQFAEHGHLTRHPGGQIRYAFIHGNWALANGRRDGRLCGVDDELPLLFETGCYADFTFPSAPDEVQPNIVNRIYWPMGDLSRARAYDRGEPARVGHMREDRILMIEGPLGLHLRAGRVPLRIENANITSNDPATPQRVSHWVAEDVHIAGRPEWVFVKVHTHGSPEPEAASLLGEGGHVLHQALTGMFNDGDDWVLHYVTAREMYNIAVAAMEGRSGNPDRYRNHRLPPPPAAR
jgi:hypothetical protein